MRLVSFRHADAAKIGAVVEGGIVDLSGRTSSRWPSLRDAIAAKALPALAAAAKGAKADLSFDEVELSPAIPNPDKILCIGLNYASHVGEVGRQLPTVPSVFSRLHNTLVPHGGNIVRPRASIDFDFEGELAVVIGERCRHVPRASALSVVAGYTCFLDGSVRDFQKHSVTAGKNFPATGPLGPWLVTSDVITDPQRLELTTRLNGSRGAARHHRSHDLRRRHHHRISLDRDLAGAGRRHRHRHARRRRSGPQAAALDEDRRQGRGRDLRHRNFERQCRRRVSNCSRHRREAGWSRDAKVIGLISAAHFTSHVHLMLLPPIFGPVREAFGVSYIEIGVALTAYNVISAALQTPAGFLVDRIGPRAMLTGGLLLGAAALMVAALLPHYWIFVVAYAFLGLANTVYHPADYSILSATIDEKRIGKAFSIHNFAGFFGSGVTPAMVLAIAAVWGWQGAFLAAAGLAIVSALLLIVAGGILPRSVRLPKNALPGAKVGLELLLSGPDPAQPAVLRLHRHGQWRHPDLLGRGPGRPARHAGRGRQHGPVGLPAVQRRRRAGRRHHRRPHAAP